MAPSETDGLTTNMTHVPLHWRMPNPPTFFVGREAEQSVLLGMIERSPVTVVTGIGGNGKSALVAKALHNDRCERTLIRIGMRPSDSLAQLCVTMLKAAFEVTQRGAQDWSDAAQSMKLLVSAVLETAETSNLFFVLEDLHNGDAHEIDSFLLLLHQYASQSRWVVTMRRQTQLLSMTEQHLVLNPLPTNALAELAELCAPDRPQSELREIAQQADGSPWRLRQMLSHTSLALKPSGTLTDSMDTPSSDLLRALSVLELPIPPDVLGQFAEIPSASQLGELVQAGMLEPGSERLRLHDRARQLIRETTDDNESKVLQFRLVQGLKDDHRSASRLEAIRLALSVDIDEAIDLLEAQGIDLIGRGHTPRIWEMISRVSDARLDSWRFQLAIHLAGGDPMQWALSRPEPKKPKDRVSWITIQYLAGRAQTALEAVSKLITELTDASSPRLALVCSLTCYRALMQLGRTEEACATLRGIQTSNPLIGLQRDAALSRALVVSGQFDAGFSLAQKVRADWPELTGSIDPEIRGEIASAFILLGRLRDAADALGEADSTATQRPVHSVGGRLRQLFLDVRRGHIGKAQRWIESLDEGPKTASVLNVFIRTQQAVLGIAMGQLQVAESAVEAARKEATRSGNGYMYQWANFTRLTLAWHRGERFHGQPLPAGMSEPVGPQAVAIRAFERAQAVRFGDTYETEVPDTPVLEAQIIDLIASAEAALIANDIPGARRLATQAHRVCDEHELGLVLADVLRTLCDIELVSGDMARLNNHAIALGRRIPGSLHYGPLAAFYKALSEGKGPGGRSLWSWAKMQDESPILADRCATYLGINTNRANQLDQAILTAMGQTLKPVTALQTERSEAWGVDVNQREVWIGDRQIQLGRSTIALKLLDFMARNGGQATKAELAGAVWKVAEYHPFQDDKRIQVTVRRLRQQIGDEPEPECLVTTEEGYAFGPSKAFILHGGL